MAHHLGLPAQGARIWRRAAADPLIETTWGGSIAIGCYGASIGARRVVAVAGAIAVGLTVLAQPPPPPEVTIEAECAACILWDRLDPALRPAQP